MLQTVTGGRGVVIARSVMVTGGLPADRLIRLIGKLKLASQGAHCGAVGPKVPGCPASRHFANGW
jgi:hypothetical protein